MSQAEIYKNSPLVEAIFEVRFPGEPAIECHRDLYFDKIRSRFPQVFVPNVEHGVPMALQPYHFRSADNAETVMISLNRFAFSTKKYMGFAKFSQQVIKLANSFFEMYSIEKLNRTGLRYINYIPFVREADCIPWKHYFTIEMELPATSLDDLLNIHLAFEGRSDSGKITTQLSVNNGQNQKEAFILDFDFVKQSGLEAKKVGKYLEESHTHTKVVFEKILTEQYKAVMRGEVVK